LLDTNLRNLVARLNRVCSEALREAAHLCLSRTHYDVEIEHFLLTLLRSESSDLIPILHQWGIARAEVMADFEKALRGLKTDNHATPRFSPHLTRWLQSAWLIASIDYGAVSVRSGHLLLALLTDDEFVHRAREASPRLRDIKVQELQELFLQLLRGSVENEALVHPETVPSSSSRGVAGSGEAPALAPPDSRMLDQFSIDLTAQARKGLIDPIVGRDDEIRKMVDVLLRRRKNNPMVVGEAGVGKTAIVEGLALRIAKGDVPDSLKQISIRALDMTLLQAGAGVRGEFENRLKEIIKEIKSSPSPIVLFIDEAHILIGAGAAAGQGDAANLLKPALARGELRTIAATTYSEFKQYFEKDSALERRFQPIHVPEPDVPTAILMLRAVVRRFETHHGVRVLDEAVRAAVTMSDRYLSGRNLPDKAVDLIDTACARVALARAALPEPLERLERQVEHIDVEIRSLDREMSVGDADHTVALEKLRRQREEAQSQLSALKARFDTARALMERILAAHRLLEADPVGPQAAPADLASLGRDELRASLAAMKRELSDVQGRDELVAVCVDQETIAQILSAWTGIPLGRMLADDFAVIQGLAAELGKRVVGQSAVLEEISKRISTSRARIEDPQKPIGVFLLTGPSGVGKTETALALAETLYGGERNLISINMSEYQEAHSIANLKGAVRGYVSYGEGGALTEPVRQRPYSVVLLDEVEKAHQDVMEVFYQVFDKGTLEDTTGRVANFRNTVILLTSNLGGDQVVEACLKRGWEIPDNSVLREVVMPPLRAHFPAAFLGRVIVLPFAPLSDEMIGSVARLKLDRIARRVREEHQLTLEYDGRVVEAIVGRCVEVESGARNVDHIISDSLLPEIGRRILGWMADGAFPASLKITTGEDGTFRYESGVEPTPAGVAKPGKQRTPREGRKRRPRAAGPPPSGA